MRSRLPCLSIHNIDHFWLINGSIDWIGHKLINAAGYMINISVPRQLNASKSSKWRLHETWSNIKPTAHRGMKENMDESALSMIKMFWTEQSIIQISSTVRKKEASFLDSADAQS